MSIDWPVNAKVKFTQERLSILTPRDRQGLAGRIGVIQSDSRLAGKPTVYFPAADDKPELRLFGVDPRHIELMGGQPKAVTIPDPNDDANHSNHTSRPSDVEPASPDGAENLSQSDADNLFD
jgi:hypothetical protein